MPSLSDCASSQFSASSNRDVVAPISGAPTGGSFPVGPSGNLAPTGACDRPLLSLSDCASSASAPRVSAKRRRLSLEVDGGSGWCEDQQMLYRRLCDVLFDQALLRDSASVTQAVCDTSQGLHLDSPSIASVLDHVAEEIGVLCADAELCSWSPEQQRVIFAAFDRLRPDPSFPEATVVPFLVTSGQAADKGDKPRLSLSDCASSDPVGHDAQQPR